MAYQLVESSPKAKAKIVSFVDSVGITRSEARNTKYPFGDLPIGMSFAVPFADTSEIMIRNNASLASKRCAPKRFVVIKHSEHSVFEVARIA